MTSNAVRRLTRELKQLENSSNPQLVVRPSSESMLVWHFVLHSLPADTPYSEGCYYGKLTFPDDYPHKPPSLMMLTENGRLETDQRLCLSMTDFHPESWNPAWSIESILVGLISFMIDESEPKGIGVVKVTTDVREELAKKSWTSNASRREFCDLFPDFAKSPTEPAQVDGDRSPSSFSLDDTPAAERLATDAWPVQTARLESGADQQAGAQSRVDSPGPAGAIPAVASAGEQSLPIPASPASGSASVTTEAEEDMVPECWICREDGSIEPLIQPCACSGSMSGVHASCVERWIRTHRANAQSNEVPHCSVCGEPYAGSERRPGPVGFAQHLCVDFAQQACRSVVLVGLLVMYWAAAQPDIVVATWQPGIPVRVLLLLISGSFFSYKAMVLVVSLPRGHPRPQNCLRIFHIADFRMLAVHIAEAMATVVIAALWCAYGQLPYYYFLPLCLIVVLPLINILLRHEGTPCSMRAVMVVIFIVTSPLAVLVHIGKLLWRDPKRLIDPFDGLVHVLVPLIAIPLCWFCESTIPVVVLWGMHSLVLFISVIEKRVIKRMHWKEGRIWWIAMQLSVLSAYIGNLLHSSSDVQEFGHEAQLLIFGVSLFWLSLVCCLVIQVNWGLCVEQYRAWQQRNGSFALSRTPSPVGTPATRSPSASPATSPAHANGPGPVMLGMSPTNEATGAGSTAVVPNTQEMPEFEV